MTNTAKYLVLVLIAIPLWSSAVLANRPGNPICDDGRNNLEWKQCIRLQYDVADRKLNQVYQQLISNLNNEERSLLVAAQTNWIKLRDKDCEFEVYYQSRNYEALTQRTFFYICTERITRERITELNRYLNAR